MTNFATAAASRDANEMFLTAWQGETLQAFETAITLAPKLRQGFIAPGSITARVPKTWKAGSEIHEAGAEILGQEFETGYEEFGLDTRPLITSHAFDSIDLMLASYDVRGPVTRAQGHELAKQADKRAYTLLYNAAVTANDTDDAFPGAITDSNLSISGGVWTNNSLDVLHYSGISSANIATAGETLISGIDSVQAAWDALDVPKENRFCVVDQYLFLAARKLGIPPVPLAATNASFGGIQNMSPFGAPPSTAGVGYTGELDYNGVKIFLSQNSPFNQNVTTGPSRWRMSGNANVRAICFQSEAAVWVNHMGPQSEMEYSVAMQRWLMVSKAMHGGGTLRPYCAVVLKGNGS
jgi:hypothetical protein